MEGLGGGEGEGGISQVRDLIFSGSLPQEDCSHFETTGCCMGMVGVGFFMGCALSAATVSAAYIQGRKLPTSEKPRYAEAAGAGEGTVREAA